MRRIEELAAGLSIGARYTDTQVTAEKNQVGILVSSRHPFSYEDVREMYRFGWIWNVDFNTWYIYT